MILVSCGARTEISWCLETADAGQEECNEMATNLTPVSTFTSPVTVPDAGDGVVAVTGIGNIRDPFQALTNRTELNNDALLQTSTLLGNIHQVLPETDFVTPITGARPIDDTNWEIRLDGFLQIGITGSTSLFIDITPYLPVAGATLDSVELNLTGLDTGSTHAALPASLPAIELNRVTLAGADTIIGVQETDPSASVAAYEVPHVITIDAVTQAAVMPHVILANTRYVVTMFGESGVNAQTNAVKHYNLTLGWTPIT